MKQTREKSRVVSFRNTHKNRCAKAFKQADIHKILLFGHMCVSPQGWAWEQETMGSPSLCPVLQPEARDPVRVDECMLIKNE